MRDLILGITAALLMALLPASLAFTPRDGANVAVLVAPWAAAGDAVRVVAAADGALVASRGSLALAQSVAPGFAARLYGAGALLVVDGATASACLGKSFLSTITDRDIAS